MHPHKQAPGSARASSSGNPPPATPSPAMALFMPRRLNPPYQSSERNGEAGSPSLL